MIVDGYLIDQDGKGGLAVLCDKYNQCDFESKSAKMVIIGEVDLSGFTFVTSDTSDKVYFGLEPK